MIDICTSRFIAALLTIAKRWMRPKSKNRYMYNGILFHFKKEEHSKTHYNMEDP